MSVVALLKYIRDRTEAFQAVEPDNPVPVLMPVITKVGIDPVHFGVVMTLNLMIGLLHPPLGMVLFVLARISKLSIERTTMAILPWLIPLLASLVAITLIPELTLWLPRAVGLIK